MTARGALVLSCLVLGSCDEPPASVPGPLASSSSGQPKVAAVASVASVEIAQPRGPGAVGLPSLADLVRTLDPAVVFLETEQAMFGRGRRIVAGGVGTGFVFAKEGLILTNHHVVAGASRVEAVFEKDERRLATIVGVDPPTDVAVLRVDTKGGHLAHIPLGDSDAARVGDWVVAIGNPFGLSHTVSAGIISAKGRTRHDVRGLDPSGYYDYLQTDASINPGNSGGPLLDLSGRVVGMNTAIKPAADGIGFAIPSNMLREIVSKLLEHGSVERSQMGALVASVKAWDAERLGLPTREGALVTGIAPGGAADRAGLRVDDVVIGFGDLSALTPNRLRWLTSLAGAGKTVRLKVLRSKEVVDLPLTLERLREGAVAPGVPDP